MRGKLVFSLFIVKMNSSMLVEEFPRVNFYLLWEGLAKNGIEEDCCGLKISLRVLDLGITFWTVTMTTWVIL